MARSSVRRATAVAVATVAVVAVGRAHAELPAGCRELGVALVEHSCFHASYGPFTRVTATASPERAPDVDAVHTYYEVLLAPGRGESWVTYQVASPGRAGAWAIFHDPAVPLRVENARGEVLVPLLVQPVGDCAALPTASVFRLDPARHRIAIGPAAVGRTMLVLEHVDDFVVHNGRDRDADGWGDPGDVVTSVCKPPAGYVANDRDCDDTDPQVHPAATERCDGVDQNCNGVPDDDGLPCRFGVGACETTGERRCSNGVSRCIATAGASPASEGCDGVDQDCDGVSDEEEAGLCGTDAAAPRCVRVLGEVRCGCDTDADCGGPLSGKICDDRGRRCVEGCVDAPGRNGCPGGRPCSSSDPVRPGRCEAPSPPDGSCGGGGCHDAACHGAACEPGADPEPPRTGSCACRVTGGGSSLAGALALMLAVLAAARRRAR